MISLFCFHFEYIFSLFHQTVFGLALVSAPICFDFCPSPDALYSSPFGLSPNSNSILNPWSSISLSGFSHNPKIFRIKQTSKMLDKKKKKCWTSKIEGISFIFALKLNQQNLGKGKRTFIFCPMCMPFLFIFISPCSNIVKNSYCFQKNSWKILFQFFYLLNLKSKLFEFLLK